MELIKNLTSTLLFFLIGCTSNPLWEDKPSKNVKIEPIIYGRWMSMDRETFSPVRISLWQESERTVDSHNFLATLVSTETKTRVTSIFFSPIYLAPSGAEYCTKGFGRSPNREG